MKRKCIVFLIVLCFCLKAVTQTNIENPFAGASSATIVDNAEYGGVVITAIEYTGGTAPADLLIPDRINGQNVIALGTALFYQNTDIVNLTLPGTLKVIGERAMREMTSLTAVHIPASVEIICVKAFNKSTAVTSFTFEPNSALFSVGEYDGDPSVSDWRQPHANDWYEVFNGLTCEITLPDDFPTTGGHIGASDWSNTTDGVVIAAGGNGDAVKRKSFSRTFTKRTYAYTLTAADVSLTDGVITEYLGSASEFDIPKEIDGQTIIAIGDGAFDKKGVTKVYIPNTIKRLEASAFNDCPIQEMQFEEHSSLMFLGTYAIGRYQVNPITLPTSYPTDCTSASNWVKKQPNRGAGAGLDGEIEAGDRPYEFYRSVRKSGAYTLSTKDVDFADGVITNVKLEKETISETIKIPNEINGTPVTELGYASFWFIGAKTFVLPASLEIIRGGALEWVGFEHISFEAKSSLHTIEAWGFANVVTGKSNTWSFDLPTDCPDGRTATQWTVPAYSASAYTSASSRTIAPSEHILNADELTTENGIITGCSYTGGAVEIIIPDNLGLTGIANNVFQNMGLLKATLPLTIDSIGEKAFMGNNENFMLNLPVKQEGKPATDYYWTYTNAGTVKITSAVTSSNWDNAFLKKYGEKASNPGWTRSMEKLKRGIVAIHKGSSGNFVSWRLLGTDSPHIKFNLYKDGTLLNSEPMHITNYTDASGTTSSRYKVVAVLEGQESDDEWLNSKEVSPWSNQGLKMKLDKPADDVAANGQTYSYSPNDASVADLDGDGEYELILKWEPSMFSTNMPGFSGNCIIDAYEFDGNETTQATRLWRIDFGVNIKAGSHYNAFMVYDLDGDGKAEMVAKTAPGTKDGKGNYVKREESDPDYNVEYDEDPTRSYIGMDGTVNGGPEYLTLFDGKTGVELHTITYKPTRHHETMFPTANQQTAVWGDSWNNRGDRFLGAIAYLDGENPSVVMTRGLYTRVCLAAYDVVEQRLVERWFHDSGYGSSRLGSYGQGYHSLTVGDADDDGRDEIVYGACTIDDDGTLLSSTHLGHGDALHMADMDPDRDGLEVWAVHESTGAAYGYNLWDPATGQTLFGKFTGSDNGRGLAADIDPNYRGLEMWSVASQNVYDCKGNVIADFNFFSQGMINYRVYWDGDLQDELFNRNVINKWNPETQKAGRLTTLYSINGGEGNNGTKYNSCLQADVFGDWREEIILRAGDDQIVIYSTVIPTEHRLFTLMHDPTYRLAVAWQNVGYNQPPHLGFYIGDGVGSIPMPDIFAKAYDGKVRLEYAAVPEASGTITCAQANGSELDEGMALTLTCTVNKGYKFLGWYNHNQPVGENTTLDITLEADTKIEARTDAVADIAHFVRGDDQMKVYPNPANDFITVEAVKSTGILEIFSIDGTLLKTKQSFNQKSTIDVSDLSAGLYFILTEDGEVQRIVINDTCRN